VRITALLSLGMTVSNLYGLLFGVILLSAGCGGNPAGPDALTAIGVTRVAAESRSSLTVAAKRSPPQTSGEVTIKIVKGEVALGCEDCFDESHMALFDSANTKGLFSWTGVPAFYPYGGFNPFAQTCVPYPDWPDNPCGPSYSVSLDADLNFAHTDCGQTTLRFNGLSYDCAGSIWFYPNPVPVAWLDISAGTAQVPPHGSENTVQVTLPFVVTGGGFEIRDTETRELQTGATLNGNGTATMYFAWVQAGTSYPYIPAHWKATRVLYKFKP